MESIGSLLVTLFQAILSITPFFSFRVDYKALTPICSSSGSTVHCSETAHANNHLLLILASC